MDYVIAGQAFHWFEPQKAKQEFTRILRRGGWVVLFWNSRRSDTTPFLCAYEELLQQFGTDYQEVHHKTIDRSKLQKTFSGGEAKVYKLYNEQLLDYPGLKGRLLSSSYVPIESHPEYPAMIEKLNRIFQQHNVRGGVCMEYNTEVYVGRLG